MVHFEIWTQLLIAPFAGLAGLAGNRRESLFVLHSRALSELRWRVRPICPFSSFDPRNFAIPKTRADSSPIEGNPAPAKGMKGTKICLLILNL